MEGSWWKKKGDLDPDQARFYGLPLDGSFLLSGPPGSGKTNLLLLRARFIYGSNLKNVLFLVLGTALREFIKTGLKGRDIPEERVMSFRQWANSHARAHAPEALHEVDWQASFAENRSQIVRMIKKANEKADDVNLYDAVFVDEAQDFTLPELKTLRSLTSRLHLAGDKRQSISAGAKLAGVDAELSLTSYALKYHYRIGKRICELGDRVYRPKQAGLGLADTSRYPEHKLESSVSKYPTNNRAEQFEALAANIGLQLRAFPDEAIAILIPRRDILGELSEFLGTTVFSDETIVHTSGASGLFSANKRVHVLTIHAAKGTEFRAVHILAAELLHGFMGSKEVFYTALTRAKTSLSIYYSGTLEPFIDTALSEIRVPDDDELFPGEDELS